MALLTFQAMVLLLFGTMVLYLSSTMDLELFGAMGFLCVRYYMGLFSFEAKVSE